MQCSNCNFDNPSGMNFCGACGAPLNRPCPNCAFENPANFKFCGQCGTTLAGISSLSVDKATTSTNPSSVEAERRHITVMFCDLVGATTLSTQLDPEELRQVITAYQAACVGVVNRFEGHVAQYLGDGILIYFGYPMAHEDDAQRTVRTGLGIIEAIDRLSTRLQKDMGLDLQVRIGIHTGLVVVGQMGSGDKYEQLALGDTPNIAARLEGMAQSNTIAISEATEKLIQGYFSLQNLGSQSLKGIADPITVYQVLGEQGVRSRLEAAVSTGLTPLVGREQELSLLLAQWQKVVDGSGQVICLNGGAGLGKSRLLHGFKEQLPAESYRWLECYCSPYHKNSALYPIIGLLQQIFDLERDDSPEDKLNKLSTTLKQREIYKDDETVVTEIVPLLASLLSIPLTADYPALTLPAPRQKQRLLTVLLSLLLDLTKDIPALFVIEDLHWVDPSTLELLDLLVEQATTAPLYAIFTFRPNFTPTWPDAPNLIQLTLTRLTEPQVATMVHKVTHGKPIPESILTKVTAQTDGVPLFVEELTKMVLEMEIMVETETSYELSGEVPTFDIPATLQDSLMARLDRLSSVKEIAQLAATLGREFSYELLLAVSHLDEPTLHRDLARLVEAELLYQRGVPPQATYIFKHALIQDAAYQSLLRSRRQIYHQQIAHALIEQFPETVQLQPELVAHHYAVAGLTEEAIDYWWQAGQRAIQRSANLEAIDHFTQGIELLESLPSSPEVLMQQLKFQIILGTPLLMVKGYAAPDVEKAYARAWQLCQQLGEVPQLASALFGLWVFYLVSGNNTLAAEVGQQFVTTAQHSKDLWLLLEANEIQGVNAYYMGELAEAHLFLEQGVELYHPHLRPVEDAYTGTDHGVACLSHLALTLWLLGYPDKAVERSDQAVALARRLNHPFSQVFSLSFAAWLHQYRREMELAQTYAEAAIALSEEQGFIVSIAVSTILRGWAMASQGDCEDGIDQLHQGLALYESTGAALDRSHFLALLAEAHYHANQPELGLTVLEEATTITTKLKKEHTYEAELYRLQGNLLLQQGQPVKEAEACFQRAIALAVRQEAKMLELRAVMDLCRLWAAQGRSTEAHLMLAETCEWFLEGFETNDLKEAETLLGELSADIT
ncbi:MAG: adenylate/guanylate cyclase domain-containing protein [Chloroflexota bacterium]